MGYDPAGGGRAHCRTVGSKRRGDSRPAFLRDRSGDGPRVRPPSTPVQARPRERGQGSPIGGADRDARSSLGSFDELAPDHIDLEQRLDPDPEFLLEACPLAGLLEHDEDVHDLGADRTQRFDDCDQGAAGRDYVVDEDDAVAAPDVVDEHVRLRIAGRLLERHLSGQTVLTLADEDIRSPDAHRQSGGEREAHRFRRDDLVAALPVADPGEFGEPSIEDLGTAQRDPVGDRMHASFVLPAPDAGRLREPRAQPTVASWTASSDGRTVGSRWANFWRSAATFIVSNMSRLLLLAAPSVPRPMTTAASFIAAYGIAWPVESFMFEMGQCATRVPVRASSSISDGSSQHPWAAMTSFARNPRPSRYFAGRAPVSVRQSSTSRLVSERWMWINEPVLSASSRIRRSESFETV